MKFLKRIFKPPIFDDELKTQQAYMLHIILWTLVCVPIPFIVYTLAITPENISRSLTQAIFGETINIILLVMLRRGYVRAASIIQVGAFWSFFTVTAITGTGVQGEAYLLGYGLVIAIAGMLLGGRGALVMTLLSLLAGGGMVYAHGQGMIATGFSSSPLTTWIVSLVLFPVAATLQQMGTRITRQTLVRARASEERYRLISQISSDYTFSTVMDADGSMQLDWVAGAFEEITGYTFDEYVSSGGWLAHLHPDDLTKDAQDTAILKTNQPVVTELRTFRKDQEQRWVRVYANPVWDENQKRLTGIVGAVQDITEQKQAEEALRESEAIYRQAIEVAGAVPYRQVFAKDDSNIYTFLGEGIRQITGYGPEDFNDTLWNSLILERHLLDDLASYSWDESIQKVRTGSNLIWKCEYLIRARDGKKHWVFEAAVDLRDEHGVAHGSIGFYQDITERKQAEEIETNRRELLEKVIAIGKEVTGTQGLEVTLERIWHAVHDVLEFDRLGIYLFNPENNSMDGTYGTNNQGEMVDETWRHISLDKETSETRAFASVVKDVNGIYVTHQYDNEHDPLLDPVMSGVKDFAAIAAWAGNKPVAVLCVDNVISQGPISDEQLEALRLFAGYAGLAIENSRLNESLQRELEIQKQAEEDEANRRSMLEKIVLLGQRVTEVKDLKTTLERIWHGVHDDIGFDRLAIFLYDQKTNTVNGTLGTDNDGRIVEEWDYRRTLDPTKPTSFIRALEQPNGLFFTKDFGVEFDIPEGHEMHFVKDFATASAWAGDKPVAIITVDNHPSGRRFTQAQLESLRLFAGYAGLAIENSHLNAALQTELDQRQSLITELENKNAELERFTYTVSHDLKSPLVTITGFLGYLELDALSGRMDLVKSSIKRISGAATKMQALLNDLLELSRIGRLMNPPEVVPFEAIVHEAIDHVRGHLDEVNAVVEIQRDFPSVRGDRVRLVEVIQNLVENAVKYSNPNERLRIEIGLNGHIENGYPVFYVRDNGIGIEPRYHERIFGLFNKLDAQSEGTGIGLSLVKRIIEVHNGRIWVESEKDKGATFYFTLPTPQTKE